MRKALVLSSGGIDSTTCIGIAVDDLGKENVSTVSIYYGQKHSKELECARKIAQYYGLKHYELDLSNIFRYSDCSLLNHSSKDIEHGSYAHQIEENEIVSTYVPFRNGLMLSTVASLALSIYPNDGVDVYLGNHADDVAGSAYADCSLEFTNAMKEAIHIGSYKKVSVVAPLVSLSKTQVVKKGLELNVPYDLTWSCYEGNEKQCGVCGTCIDRKKAFEQNGVVDPVGYQQ